MRTIKEITGIVAAAAFIALGFGQSNTFAKPKPTQKVEHVKLLVSGMYCQDCSKTLESSLCKLKGAKNVKADYKTGYASLDVPASSKITSSQIKQTVEKAGFSVKDVKYVDNTSNNSKAK